MPPPTNALRSMSRGGGIEEHSPAFEHDSGLYLIAASLPSSGVAASRALPYRSTASSASVGDMHNGGENELTSMNGKARVNTPASCALAATTRWAAVFGPKNR